MKQVELIAIDQTGAVPLPESNFPDMLRENCAGTGAYYKVIGFQPPWIGYVSVAEGKPVGGGAFKGAPQENKVEIAYYTLPELEQQGWATATARELINIAKSASPEVVVTAQTLPERNASTALLTKLGFELLGPLMTEEDGEVWEWRLKEQPNVATGANRHG